MLRPKNALSVCFPFYLCKYKLKGILSALLLFISVNGFSQTLMQQNFTGIIVPQYMSATTSNRLPVIFRAKVSGLSSNSIYRYYTQGATNDSTNGASMDFGALTSGAGVTILVNSTDTTYTIESSPGLSAAGKYQTFTTDASGSYTGWFGIMNLGNSRYTAGNQIYPTITLNNGNGGTTPAIRFALDVPVKVLALAKASGNNDGTGIWATSAGKAKNIVALYDNVSGLGRPLAMTYIENEGTTYSSPPSFYSTNVNSKDTRWGSLIPNVNSNGVRKIEQFSISTGSSVGCNTDADGIWPTGNINTVNPTGGTTAIQISGTDAPLNTTCGNVVSGLSDISTSNTFIYPQNINYILYREASDISLNNTSLEVASFVLRDGGGTNDADNLTTTLTALSFNVTNAGFIRRAALYNGNIELSETTVTGTVISFSGFSLTAPDNGSATLTLRVSYTDLVTDNAQNIFTVSSATASNSGSGFINANAGGSASPDFYDINRIEVTATKLAFTTEPSYNATVYKLIFATPIVSAKDDFGNTDEDFTSEITLGNTGNLAMENGTANMVSGTANFPLLLFTQVGNTTLTANATGLQSASSLITILINDAKKWDGEAGTNLWSDAANWSDNTVPAATDVVILDNTFITNSYNVVLPDVYATVSYLRISASQDNAITFTLPVTNTACPGFTIGDNSSGTEDFIIGNGGIFINANGCSSAQGFVINAQGSAKSIKVENGGKYIHRNSKSHIEILDATTWEENANLTFDVVTSTAYSISIANRQLGSLTLLAEAKGATQAYSSNFASTAVIKGHLITEPKATFALSGHGNLQVGGNIVNNGTFSTGNTNRKLVMNGTNAQAFSGTGTYTIKALEIDNMAGVTLNIPLTLSNTTGSGLTLTEGNLHTSSTNILALQELGTVTGGNKNSFVAGPIIKTFSTNSQSNIVLPLGKDTLYRPLTISPESISAASTFKAEYFDATAPYDLTKFDTTLEAVSDKEYWNVQRTAGSTNAILSFTFGESSEIIDLQNLKITSWNDTEWINQSEQEATGTLAYGSVSTNNLSQFGVFAFGYAKSVALPVSWLYFTAKVQDKNALLQWATACEINNNGFEIERSLDGKNFEVIGWVNGNGTSNQKHFYSYADMEFGSLHTSTVYYRLKQTDFNGAYEYSTIETLRKNEVRLTDISIYTDAQKCLNVQIKSVISASTQVEILNMNGHILKQLNTYISAGNNIVKLPLQDLKAGLYVVRVLQNGTLHTEKIVL